MRKLLLALAALALLAPPAFAQNAPSDYPGCEYVASPNPATLGDKQTARLNCDQLRNLKVTGGTGSSIQPDTTVTGSATSTAVLTNFPVDVSGYNSVSIQFTSVGAGNTVIFEQSNDGVTYNSMEGSSLLPNGFINGGTVAPVTTSVFTYRISTRFFRARVTIYGSGTVTAVATFKTQAYGPTTVTVIGNNQDDSTATGVYPVAVGGIMNTTLPTYSNGDRTQMQFGTRGGLHVTSCGESQTICETGLSAGADGVSNSTAAMTSHNLSYNFNGTSFDRTRGIVNSMNQVSTGITASGVVAQCDDTSPTALSENNWGAVRQQCATHALVVDGGCNQQVAIAVTAGNTTQLVALSGSTVIRVCSIKTAISATGSYTLLSGTGANCATPANSTGAMPLITGNADNWGDGTGVVWQGSAGGELCMTAVTGNLTGVIRYSQY